MSEELFEEGEEEDDEEEEVIEKAFEELELQSLHNIDDIEDTEDTEITTPVFTPSTENTGLSFDNPVFLSSGEIPEGTSLRTINLQTNPSEDDFAKHLVRSGRLGVKDVVEIVDANGSIIGTKVLPHAENRYLEEVALEESVRRMSRSPSALSSDHLLHGILQYGSEDLIDNFGDELFEDDENEEDTGSASDIFGEGSRKGPMKYPKTVESLYKLIEPNREEEFNNQIEQINKQIVHTQHEICLEHKERKMLRVRTFEFEKNLITGAVSEAGILYLPGNFLYPIIGYKINIRSPFSIFAFDLALLE